MYELWDKYEAITMHFNDLLIKLRVQALAGVAALSTAVGLFAKFESTAQARGAWLLAALILLGISAVWVAIWLMDFCYYNRLLSGAVSALEKIEKHSATSTRIKHIDLSTLIEECVKGDLPNKVSRGVWSFYIIVLLTLLAGAVYSFWAWRGGGE